MIKVKESNLETDSYTVTFEGWICPKCCCSNFSGEDEILRISEGDELECESCGEVIVIISDDDE